MPSPGTSPSWTSTSPRLRTSPRVWRRDQAGRPPASTRGGPPFSPQLIRGACGGEVSPTSGGRARGEAGTRRRGRRGGGVAAAPRRAAGGGRGGGVTGSRVAGDVGGVQRGCRRDCGLVCAVWVAGGAGAGDDRGVLPVTPFAPWCFVPGS